MSSQNSVSGIYLVLLVLNFLGKSPDPMQCWQGYNIVHGCYLYNIDLKVLNISLKRRGSIFNASLFLSTLFFVNSWHIVLICFKILSSFYQVYKIEVKGSQRNWFVFRRYTDFTRLNDRVSPGPFEPLILPLW